MDQVTLRASTGRETGSAPSRRIAYSMAGMGRLPRGPTAWCSPRVLAIIVTGGIPGFLRRNPCMAMRVSYAHLMAVQRRAGNASRTLQLLEELRASGLTPSTVHYSLALRACEQHRELPNRLQRALALYSQMRSQGLRLDSRGLLAATRLCDAHGRPDLSARLRQERSMDLPFGGAGKQRRSGGNS